MRYGEFVTPRTKFLPEEPVIEKVELMTNGDVWVTNCRSERDLPPGIARRYDRIEGGSHQLVEILLRHQYKESLDHLWHLGDGDFLWIVNGQQKHTLPGQESEESEPLEDDRGYRIVYLRGQPDETDGDSPGVGGK